jgi:glycerol-3-phosphate acyltransferase PlsX
MTRIALDLMGGDHAPEALVDGALLVADELPDVQVVLVGSAGLAGELLAERDQAGRFETVDASESVAMDENPALAIRAKRDASVRVCARLVRDGQADAMVSVGSTGATLAAAVLTLGRLPGVTRPPLAAVIPSRTGPLVFLDAGATPQASCDLLAQYALAGAAFATIRLGIAQPRVGLLTNGEEAGKGDDVRKEAYDVLARLPIRFVGNVEGRDIPMGGLADVIVTDGFTGNVLVKGLEGATTMLTEVLLGALTGSPEREAAAKELLPALGEATARLSPDALGGAVLLGVDGVVVVGHGSAGPRAVASCIRVADQAVREGLVPKVTAALADLIEARRDVEAVT